MSNVTITVGTSYIGTDKEFDSGYTREEWEDTSEEDRWDIINDKVHQYVSISITDGDEYLEL